MDEQERKQLNRAIAEALGYRLGNRNMTTDDGFDFAYTVLLLPDGTEFEFVKENGSPFYGLSGHNQEGLWEYIPDYAADLNAVADALPEDWLWEFEHGHTWELEFRWAVTFGHMAYDAVIGEGATRHEAAARALLAWAKAQQP